MNREEIYDHLAQVYLGKRKKADEKKLKQRNVWLLINVIITLIIFASSFYGLTAFLVRQGESLKNNVIFSLHRGPIRVEYNFKESTSSDKTFSLTVPDVDASKYGNLEFSIRAKEEGTPGVVKIVLKNQRNESAFHYVQGVGLSWKQVSIPFDKFYQITDWTNLIDISFVLEDWNVDDKSGIILIENINFSSI